ncbi:MAG: NifU family protein [Saprospiraceae bacterium]|nr:NifU family protein [Saprospiraceae bacterium]
MVNPEIRSLIESAIDDVRPHLLVDGGDIEIIEITDDLDIKLRWMGTCQNCSMSEMTLQAGVEAAIRSKVPKVKTVTAIS